MAREGLRLTITLSDFATRKLICWCRSHDKSKTGFAASLVETAIENNLELIDSLVRDIAEYEGTDPITLEKKWMSEENYPSNKN